MRFAAAVALASAVAFWGCLKKEEGIVDPRDDQTEVTEIPAIEYQVLVALYESTNGTGWTDNDGVHCDGCS